MPTIASKSDLSAFRDDVGASWGASWAILGSLETSWGLGGSWGSLGKFWRGLGVVLGGLGVLLGRSYGGLGAILKRSRLVLGRSRAPGEESTPFLDESGSALNRPRPPGASPRPT